MFESVVYDFALLLQDISADQGRQFHRLLKILSERSAEIFNLKSKDGELPYDMVR